MTRDGSKRAQGLFYVQVGPERASAALGFHQPEPEDLASLRDRIAARRTRWRQVETALAGSGLALSRDDAAARLPRPFKADEVGDLTETLKLKSFVVSRPLARAELADAGLVERLADFAVDGRPLLDFGWAALDGRTPS